MISIIICSNNKELLTNVSENIKNTICTEHEIITIDNREGKYSICEAYNAGALKSKYEYLCFVHEDVIFRTTDWGNNAISHINSIEKAGVIGVAGSTFKTKMFSSWWQPATSGIEPKRINIIQQYKYENSDKKLLHTNPLSETRSPVACLDGVFLFTKKEVWQKIKFDDHLFKGFHGYDLDFTLNVGMHLNNYVVFDILLEHFSEGKVDFNWIQQIFLVHKKNHKRLPIIKGEEIEKAQLRSLEKSHLEKFLIFADEFPFKKLESAKMGIALIRWSRLLKFNPFVLKKIVKMILRSYKILIKKSINRLPYIGTLKHKI